MEHPSFAEGVVEHGSAQVRPVFNFTPGHHDQINRHGNVGQGQAKAGHLFYWVINMRQDNEQVEIASGTVVPPSPAIQKE
jgi:hypothetical protein